MVEGIREFLCGIKISDKGSTFIDAYDLADSSDHEWIKDEDPDEDYSSFGQIRKIDF